MILTTVNTLVKSAAYDVETNPAAIMMSPSTNVAVYCRITFLTNNAQAPSVGIHLV